MNVCKVASRIRLQKGEPVQTLLSLFTKHTSLGQCRNNHHTIMLVFLIRLRIAADTLGIDA